MLAMSMSKRSTAVDDPDPNLVDFQLEVKKPRAVVEVCILGVRCADDSPFPSVTVVRGLYWRLTVPMVLCIHQRPLYQLLTTRPA